jgi:anti-sigma factor RsiW
MSLSQNELLYLMAYVDGQVDDDELPEVEALLAKSEEARQIVAQHRAMGDWVRSSSDARAAEAGADRIATRVAAEIEQLGGGKVIELEKERARLALNRQRVKEFSALFVAFAAAAAFFLLPTRPPEPVAQAPKPVAPPAPSPPPSTAVASATPAGSPSAAAVATTDDTTNVDVQAVDSSHPFSIFYVPGVTGVNAHATSVVVWIGDEPAP